MVDVFRPIYIIAGNNHEHRRDPRARLYSIATRTKINR